MLKAISSLETLIIWDSDNRFQKLATMIFFNHWILIPILSFEWAATWQNQQSGCVPSEASDQPGHPPSLIRVFAVRMKKAWVLTCSYSLSAQRRQVPRLIRVFAGRTVILLILSCRGSNVLFTLGPWTFCFMPIVLSIKWRLLIVAPTAAIIPALNLKFTISYRLPMNERTFTISSLFAKIPKR